MNKQEALVAILEVCRKWERTDSEVRREDVEVSAVFSALAAAVRDLELLLRAQPSHRTDVQTRQRLITAGAAALWLLVDEVTVVESGPDVERWLAEGGAGRHGPTVINGVINGPTPMIVEQTRYVPVIVPGRDAERER